ncbi:MAG: hypothetical protein ACYTGV_12045, partial [Planctomycetota bacterium]
MPSRAPDWKRILELPRVDLADRPCIGGLYGGALGLALAALLPPEGPCLVLHPDPRPGDDLAGDLALFGVERGRRMLFPDLDDDERGLERLAVLARLHRARDGVVIASMQAATQPVPARTAMRESTVRLAKGIEEWGPEVLTERLASEEWQRVSLVTGPGEFSVRGDILDLFAPGMESAVRLEYFGDELESIRSFDPETQRATGTLGNVEFAARTRELEFATLIDHFEQQEPVFLVEPDDAARALVTERPGADLDAMRTGDLLWKVQQVEPVAANVEKLRARIVEACEGTRHAFFACRNEAEETRVRHLLGGQAPRHLSFLRGRLSSSFHMPERGLTVLGYDDLLQHLSRRRPAPKRPVGRAIEDFLDLEAGDLVVHLA